MSSSSRTSREASLAAEADREKRAVAASILPLLFPRAVAVIGASNDPGSIGGRLFHNLLSEGFTGPLYPVNPTSQVVRSVKAYPSILDVPAQVDLAFVVVPQRIVTEVTRQCAKAGVRGVVAISAGFSEVGEEGALREAELLDVIRKSGMRMVGPNCMGVLNTDPGVRLNASFSPIFPPHGHVALSSQSGALGLAILKLAERRHVGLSTFVSVGNKADVSGNDLIQYWTQDENTDVILLYLESFGNPRKFAEIARRAGLDLPSACEQGWDLACAVQVLEGRLDHADARRYYAEDERAGFALICTAKPLTDLRLRTHASDQMREHRLRNRLPAPRGRWGNR